MKILRKTMLIFSAVLLTTACSKSGIEEIDPNTPEENGGATKTLSLTVPAMIGETRAGASASAEESAIQDVWVFQYLNDGSIFGKPQHFDEADITPSGSNKTVSAQLDDAESTIYVIANVGKTYAAFAGDSYPQTLSAFEELKYTFGSAFAQGELASGTTLPMVGYTTINAGATKVEVDLKRMVAKIDFTITVDTSAPDELKLTLKSAQLEYVSNQTTFKAPTAGSRVPAAADANFFGKDAEFVYGTAATINVTKSTAGATLTWYVPENLAGQESSIGDKPKLKGPDKAPAYSTRIVVKGTATYKGAPNTDVSFYIYPGANATTDFNIERNKVYSISSNIKNINTADNRVQVHDFVDLSSTKDEDCSNCYMIHEAGKYKFRCNLKGNGSVVASSGISDATLSPAGCTPSVLWCSTDGVNKAGNDAVITNVDIDGNYITFETPSGGKGFVEGNAVIVLKNGSTTLWSWHIWSTAYNPDKGDAYDVYTMRTGLGLGSATENVMRCNLGAINQGTSGYAQETVAKNAYGLFYQWGRKDPFLHVKPATAGGGSVANAIANPTTFYTSSSDWTAKNDALWGNPGSSSTFTTISIIHGSSSSSRSYNKDRGSKSMFDPCPAGWRVPPQYLWMNAVTAASQAAGSPVYLTLNNTSNRQAKYIAAGYLYCSDGSLYAPDANGYYWSSSPYSSGDSSAGSLLFYAGSVYPLSNSYRGHGFSVRCVQE